MTSLKRLKLIVLSYLVLTFQSSRANEFDIRDSSLIVEDVDSTLTYAGCFDDSYIKKVISSIYNNDFNNFEKVLSFAEFSNDYNFKTDVLLALFNAMANARHTSSPIKTMTLYRTIEDIIRHKSRLLSSEQLDKVERIREEILWGTIVDESADMLAQNFFINGFNQKDTKLKRLLDELQNNSTVFRLTIERMIELNPWLHYLELINLFSTFSRHQNLDSLLLLNDIYHFRGDEYHIFSSRLIHLIDDLDFPYMLDENTKRRIDAVIPTPLQTLLAGRVCFYQITAQRDKLYISVNIRKSNRMFLRYISELELDLAAFNVEIKREPLMFNFRSVYYYNQPMYLKINETEGIDDLKVDAYIMDFETMNDTDMVDIEWKVQIEGEKVTLQNRYGLIYLCANNELLEDERLCIRNITEFELNEESFMWNVENCYSFEN